MVAAFDHSLFWAFLLFLVFNFCRSVYLLYLSGLQLFDLEYIDFFVRAYESLSFVLLVCGLRDLATAGFGLWVVWDYNSRNSPIKMHGLAFLSCLMTVFLLLTSVTFLFLDASPRLVPELEEGMKVSLRLHDRPASRWNQTQRKYNCCGILGPDDWLEVADEPQCYHATNSSHQANREYQHLQRTLKMAKQQGKANRETASGYTTPLSIFNQQKVDSSSIHRESLQQLSNRTALKLIEQESRIPDMAPATQAQSQCSITITDIVKEAKEATGCLCPIVKEVKETIGASLVILAASLAVELTAVLAFLEPHKVLFDFSRIFNESTENY